MFGGCSTKTNPTAATKEARKHGPVRIDDCDFVKYCMSKHEMVLIYTSCILLLTITAHYKNNNVISMMISSTTTSYTRHRGSKGSNISSSSLTARRQSNHYHTNCYSLNDVKYRDFSAAPETNFMHVFSTSPRESNTKKCSTTSGAADSITRTNDRIFNTSCSDSLDHPTTTTMKKSFPMEVFTMLAVLEDLGLSREICSWNTHGRSFQVHNNDKFVKFILPKFFRSIKMRSFQKQLSMYGFRRVIQNGEDYGSYYHRLFLRGKPFLCRGIIRNSRREMKTSASNIDEDAVAEPNFYALPYLPPMLPGHRYDCSIEVFGDDHQIQEFVRAVQEENRSKTIRMKNLEEEERVGMIPPLKARDFFMPAMLPADSTEEPIRMASSEQKASLVKFCREVEEILGDGNDATAASTITKRQRNASPPTNLQKNNKRTRTKKNDFLSLVSQNTADVLTPIPIEQYVQRNVDDQLLLDENGSAEKDLFYSLLKEIELNFN